MARDTKLTQTLLIFEDDPIARAGRAVIFQQTGDRVEFMADGRASPQARPLLATSFDRHHRDDNLGRDGRALPQAPWLPAFWRHLR